MTTLQDIIDDGYRELNLTAVGKSPTTAQTTEALKLLNQIYRFAIGGAAGEFLYNWPLGNYGRSNNDLIQATSQQLRNPPANIRLVAVNESAMTVYLPPRPSDGARVGMIDPHSRLASYPVTLDANGMTIEGSNDLLLNTNATNKTWLFRADLGDWVLLDDLIATDTNPFPVEFDQYFSLMLSLRLSPRSGVKWSEETASYYKMEKTKFQNRYRQSAPLLLDPSLTWTSVQSYDQYYGWRYGSNAAFNQGWGVLNNWGGYPW